MDSNIICHPSTAKKIKCSFLDYIQLLIIGQACCQLKPHLPALSSQNNEVLIFGLHSTSYDQLDWLIDWNPIHHLHSAKKMKCSFLYYIQHLIFGQAGQWTWTPSAIILLPNKWNAHFWITFNFWWSAGLVDWLKPHPPLPFSQKNEMLISVLHSTSDYWPGWSMDSNPICHHSLAK